MKSPYIIELAAGTYHWCACEKSNNWPFCDGSHQDKHTGPVTFSVENKKYVALCGCHKSKTLPFCDGSHSLVR